MAEYYAQPYDMEAKGFYFKDMDDFKKKSKKNKNSYGQIVEEYMFEFIDGDEFESEIARMSRSGDFLDVEQIEQFSDLAADDYARAMALYMIEQGYNTDKIVKVLETENYPVYEGRKEAYAEEFLEDVGIWKDAGEMYFGYDRFGRDLKIDGYHINHLYDDLENTDDEDEKEMLEEQIREAERMSDSDVGYNYVDSIGGVDELGKETLERYFDYDGFARDMDLNGEIDEIDFGGNTYTITQTDLSDWFGGFMGNPRRKRKATKRRNPTRRRTTRRRR